MRKKRIDIITIFPNMVSAVLNESMMKRAQLKKLVDLRVHDLRPFSKDPHHKVDARPFGGGPGMVMMVQPLVDAVKKIKGRRKNVAVIFLSPCGEKLSQQKVKTMLNYSGLILICGHYEGIDERVCDLVVDEKISIGDYVLTGGELPALVLTDAIVRLIPGVLGKYESIQEESFENNLLEYPHYTRPANFCGKKVPSVLLSGNHLMIQKWREEQALAKTKKNRPDLLS